MPYIPPPPTSFVGRIPPPSSAKLLAANNNNNSSTSSPTSTSRTLSPSTTSIPIPRVPASRERRSPHLISIAKRKRLASSLSSSSSSLAFAVGSPKDKRRSVFPTPPFDDHSGHLNTLDEYCKNDDESLLFPMETPVSPPYLARRDVITLATAGSDAEAKATSDLLKGLGIRVIRNGSQISIKHVVVAATAYEEEDLDRTFLFDEEVGVGEAKFQSFLTAEMNEESELESDFESDRDLDDYVK